jgi:hypothetical protein
MRQSQRCCNRAAQLSAILMLAAALPGLLSCGGSGGGTTDAPAPRPRASALDFVITPMVNGATTVAFQWSGSDASAYTLEVGSASSGSDVGRFDAGASTSFTWSGAPVGTFYARVVPRQGTTAGTASNEVIVGSIDARQMIDALIFGSGPLAVAGNAAGPLQADRMEGWQPGSTMRVTIGESAPSYVTTAVEKTAAQVGPATAGTVQAVVSGRAPDPLPSPAPGEVTVSLLSAADVKDQCTCTNCVGCAWQWLRGSVVTRGRILISTDAQHSAAAHELGHIVGLAHIISAAGVRPAFTMGFTTDGKYSPDAQLDVLDPATVRMLETLYGTGLTAGSSRTQFEAAGLVPQAASASSMGEARRTDPRRVVRTEGLETVVLKPLCR